ncbi:hypothetical protein FGADI_8105 [Fusarium gaditjirri]|uniref:FAD-binding PCMH-type domain-containing protein n=1 Tax=Fusarium gaditjirri TaxID=282569 RepID=A0A8H4T3E1_9HYPO|nr:hypothetical protein FGADI_8105 [Fusarium gaditjirri]
MLPQLFSAWVFAGLTAASVNLGTPPCNALAAAGLEERLIFPTDSEYKSQINTWFTLNSRLYPWCLVLPHNSEEVALALKTLVDLGGGAGDWDIAVKSGGHNSFSANNVANGVTIDLSSMNSTTYNPNTNLASLQPGSRWQYVYADLEKEGVVVAGGRDGDVGVGGFLLGGGTSYFSGWVGFGCDSVVNYEVVLTNGSIINANETANADLWRALKGGGSNFGVVTRFDMEAMPSKKLFQDIRYVSANYSSQVIDTLSDFANFNELQGDNALVTWWTNSRNGMSIGNIYVNLNGDRDKVMSYDKVMKLPSLTNLTKTQSMAAAAAASKVDGGAWAAGATQTFKNDPRIVQYANKLHDEYIESMDKGIGAGNYTTLMFYQPIPASYGQIGRRRGGNMLGIEDQGAAIMWTGGISLYTTDADCAIAQAEMDIMSTKIQEYAESLDAHVDLVYLNYAYSSQDPLGSYGKENTQHIRDVADKYDPKGLFQTRVPGGFKISRVE